MPKLKDQQDADRQYDPYSNENARDLLRQDNEAGVNAGIDQAEAFANDPKNATTRNLDDVRNKEETPDMGFYKPGDGKKNKQKATLKGNLKKRGPLAGVITIGVVVPAIIAILSAPTMLLQQLSETLTGKFNDQLSALDNRSTLLLKKKYSSKLTKGSCGTVTIKCKYQSIREGSGMAKRLKNAGVTIDGDKSIIPGRIKPTAFIYEGKRIPADQLVNEARTNPGLRSALRKGYDPLYAGFSDGVAAKVRAKLGLKKSSNVKPSADVENMEEDLKKTAAGTNDIPDGGGKITASDEDGKTVYKDAEGNTYTEAEAKRINTLIDEGFDRQKLADKVSKSAVKGSVKSALLVTSMGAGAVDNLCTAYVMFRVAGFAAKIYQQRQLIRYSYEFVKIAHKQKYGDLTPEEMNFFSNKLTETNSEGKAALDSDGYRYAAYGDTFSPGSFDSALEKDNDEKIANAALIQNETSRYTNGQLLNSNLMSQMVSKITSGDSNTIEKADSVCSFTKSWKGQALVFGLAAAGLFVGILSGGTSVGAGAAISAAAGVAISVAFALVQPKLIDMAKGEVIKGDENGNETGNAIVSGMGGYNAQTAQGRGLRVASEESYASYINSSNKTIASLIEEDRESRSPFDISSPNTFLGSFVASILPYTTQMKTVGSFGLAAGAMVSNTFLSLGQSNKVSAASESEQFTKCEDNEYKGYAADPFCNLRYMLPEMDTDPDTVVDYMIAGGHIAEDDPAAISQEYKDYIERCIERESSIGDPFTEDGGDGDPGTDCVVGQGGANEKRNTMFSLFYVDSSVQEGLEEDFDQRLEGSTSSGAGAEINIASFNVRGSNHDGEGGTIDYKTRMKKTVETIENEQFDVIGFQEFVSDQRTEFNQSSIGSTYKLSSNKSSDDNGNAIGWNSSKYDLLDQGIQPNLKYTVGNKLDAPWVKLQDKTTGQSFYFLNTHDPANVHDNPPTLNAQRRTDNAKEHVTFMKAKAEEGIPVFSTGDYNSGFDKRGGDVNVTPGNIQSTLPYCIMTADGTIQNAFDMYKGRNVKCPNADINWSQEDPGKDCSTQIDHLYIASAGIPITVNEFGCVKKGDKAGTIAAGNGSDHDTVKFKVAIDGGGDPNTGELAWPLGENVWKSNKADFLDAHGSTGTAWGTDGMGTTSKGAYVAVDIGAGVGAPVYAMIGGVVSSTDLCGENDGIAIKSKIGGKTLGTAYMHGKDKLFKVGDTVQAGDRIMSVGTIGCNVYGSHLHIGMAYDGKYICPQDVFLAIDKSESVDWGSLPGKTSTCAR